MSPIPYERQDDMLHRFFLVLALCAGASTIALTAIFRSSTDIVRWVRPVGLAITAILIVIVVSEQIVRERKRKRT